MIMFTQLFIGIVKHYLHEMTPLGKVILLPGYLLVLYAAAVAALLEASIEIVILLVAVCSKHDSAKERFERLKEDLS